ncbi:hypothetical protein pb186bvf_014990 [Paramecium bursaria]
MHDIQQMDNQIGFQQLNNSDFFMNTFKYNLQFFLCFHCNGTFQNLILNQQFQQYNLTYPGMIIIFIMQCEIYDKKETMTIVKYFQCSIKELNPYLWLKIVI